MFSKVLVANRGEIAVRIMRTLRSMGIRSVAVFSEADARALHVAEADEAVLIGPAEATRSYLDIARVIEAAQRTGAQAIHPGYGFLSENAEFARACEAAGITFIGPSATTIAAMGDKIAAKEAVKALGLPVVPGFNEPGASDQTLARAAESVGFPLIIKPSAGGGGKGMRVVHGTDELAPALASARREAMSAFGDDSLLLERYVELARHVEVQVIADGHGAVIHAGDRDCSLQRRHQKVVEEAPAPHLPDDVRAAMLSAAVEIARAVDYRGVGTVEFVVDARNPEDHFFLEMNTRLQVEHPVTEMVTGLDLVRLQVLIAAGEHLPVAQSDVEITGHAVEVRVYAEDGNNRFLPSSGRLIRYSVPDDVRVDSGCRQGDLIGTNYDPLLFKVIAHADDRVTALARMDAALSRTVALGLAHNIPVLRTLVRDPDVRAGRLSTRHIESLGLGQDAERPSTHAVVGAALALERALTPAVTRSAWEVADTWRIGARPATAWRLTTGYGPAIRVAVQAGGAERLVQVDDLDGLSCALVQRPGDLATVIVEGSARDVTLAVDGDRVWVGDEGASWELALPSEGFLDDVTVGEHSLDHVRSPMPGTVVLVEAQVGDTVARGAVLAVVEAMKMEYVLVAPHDGVVTAVTAQVGRSVAKDEVLAEVEPSDRPTGEETS